MSTPKHRTWALFTSMTGYRGRSGPPVSTKGSIKVYEASTVDAERDRMLGVIERLCANRAAIESQRPGIYGVADLTAAEALLRALAACDGYEFWDSPRLTDELRQRYRDEAVEIYNAVSDSRRAGR